MNRDILLEAPLGQCHELLLSQKKTRYVCLKIRESQGDVGFSHVQKPFVPSFSHRFPVSQSSGEPFFGPIPLRQEAIEHFRLFRGLWRRRTQGRPHEYTKGYMHLIHIYVCMYIYIYVYVYIHMYMYIYICICICISGRMIIYILLVIFRLYSQYISIIFSLYSRSLLNLIIFPYIFPMCIYIYM